MTEQNNKYAETILEEAASSSFSMEEVRQLQNIRIQCRDRKDVMGQ